MFTLRQFCEKLYNADNNYSVEHQEREKKHFQFKIHIIANMIRKIIILFLIDLSFSVFNLKNKNGILVVFEPSPFICSFIIM